MLDFHIDADQAVAWRRGRAISLNDLPPKYNRRWTSHQKRQVLTAIDAELITASEAAIRYNLSQATLDAWRSEGGAFDKVRPPAQVAAASADETMLHRLVEVLQARGFLNDDDITAIKGCGPTPVEAYLSAFMVPDNPII